MEDTDSTSFVPSKSYSLVLTAVGVVDMTVLILLVSTATGVEDAMEIDFVTGDSVSLDSAGFLFPAYVVEVTVFNSVSVGALETVDSVDPKGMAVPLHSLESWVGARFSFVGDESSS